MKRSTKRFAAIASIALVALVTMVAAAAADTLNTDFENPPFGVGSVNGQQGWHSLPVLPALPTGYDQAVVVNDDFAQNGGTDFGDQSLRLSNGYTSDEFAGQTYSASTTEDAGEAVENNEYIGEFQFIPTTAAPQPGLFISVSPDDGVGSRMSYVGLEDTAGGIQMTFYDTDAAGVFVGHDLGAFNRNVAHTIKFWIKFVPGDANDIVRLFVDGIDQGDRLGKCFTTWETYYKYKELEGPQVTNSLEFRSAGTAAPGTLGQGYLFDNVVNTTADGVGPAPGTCGVPEVGKITPTGTTCQQYRDNTASSLGTVLYGTKNNVINSVSPGVFFYYTKVTGETAGDEVKITQTNDSGYLAIPVQQGQTFLYNATSCTKLKWNATSSLDGSVTGDLPVGDFIIGVKYLPSALQKLGAPDSPPVTYSFATEVDGDLVDTGASVLFDKK